MTNKFIEDRKQDLVESFYIFKNEHGHFPSSLEIDACSYMISSRHIQRLYGGLIAFRKIAGLPEEDLNQTAGILRTKMAGIINKRAYSYEDKIYNELVSILGQVRVHREFPFDYPISKKRCDFWLFSRTGETIMADMFFAKDHHNFLGCLNHKMRKHKDSLSKVPLYFVSMNEEVDILKAMEKKKILMQPHWKIISYDDFIKVVKEKLT